MSHSLTETKTFAASITVPDDGDTANAASVNTPFQALANRTQLLGNLVPQRSHPSATTLGGSFGFTDFVGIGAGGVAPYDLSTSNGGAIAAGTAPAGRIGIVTLSVNATNSTATIGTPATAVRLASGAVRYRADINIPTAGDASNGFEVLVGISDSLFSPNGSVDGLFFKYLYSVNSGNWVCRVRSNSVDAGDVNTSVAAVHATAYRILEIEVNAAATSATFYIDNTLVATFNSGIPSGAGRETGLGFGIAPNGLSIAGTRTVNADLLTHYFDRTTAI